MTRNDVKEYVFPWVNVQVKRLSSDFEKKPCALENPMIIAVSVSSIVRGNPLYICDSIACLDCFNVSDQTF